MYATPSPSLLNSKKRMPDTGGGYIFVVVREQKIAKHHNSTFRALNSDKAALYSICFFILEKTIFHVLGVSYQIMLLDINPTAKLINSILYQACQVTRVKYDGDLNIRLPAY